MKNILLHATALVALAFAVWLPFEEPENRNAERCPVHGTVLREGWAQIITTGPGSATFGGWSDAVEEAQKEYPFGKCIEVHLGCLRTADSVKTLVCMICRAHVDSVLADPYWNYSDNSTPVQPRAATSKYIKRAADEYHRLQVMFRAIALDSVYSTPIDRSNTLPAVGLLFDEPMNRTLVIVKFAPDLMSRDKRNFPDYDDPEIVSNMQKHLEKLINDGWLFYCNVGHDLPYDRRTGVRDAMRLGMPRVTSLMNSVAGCPDPVSAH